MVTRVGTGFRKLSEGSQRVLSLAEEEARRLGHNYIGTEHILLELVEETEGVAARVLSSLGVDLSKVRPAIEFIVPRSEKPTGGEIGLTPRTKRAVELAADESRRMSHTYIGTEHLLIGLLREGEGPAAGILNSFGVNVDNVRFATVRILSKPESPASEAEEKPDLVSLAQQFVDLQAEAGNIETRIAEIRELQKTLPVLEDEREVQQSKIRAVAEKLRTLLT